MHGSSSASHCSSINVGQSTRFESISCFTTCYESTTDPGCYPDIVLLRKTMHRIDVKFQRGHRVDLGPSGTAQQYRKDHCALHIYTWTLSYWHLTSQPSVLVMNKKPPHQVLAENLDHLLWGEALSNPEGSLTEKYPNIRIGDVGYLTQGEFKRCFNATVGPQHVLNMDPESQRTLVPDNFQALHIPRNLITMGRHPPDMLSGGCTVDRSISGSISTYVLHSQTITRQG